MYDIIGDIHGHATILKQLLNKLGYSVDQSGLWSHPNRKAIFVGDFINRGPEIPETVDIVRKMVESQKAFAVLGNHEFNAIVYYLKDSSGKLIRKRSPKARLTMHQTISQYSNTPEQWKLARKFFKQLPLFLDLDDIRITHAAWIPEQIEIIKQAFPKNRLRKKDLIVALQNEQIENAINYTLKGYEFRLPLDLLIRDNKGINHRTFRIKWWKPMTDSTFKSASFGNKFTLPKYSIPHELHLNISPYAPTEPPFFFGHFCLHKRARIITNNLCCIDSCIGNSGILSAYRWDGEKKLDSSKIVTSESTYTNIESKKKPRIN